MARVTIPESLVQSRIDAYLKEHHDEVVAMIDKKIATAVRSEITDQFRTGMYSNGSALAPVKKRVDDLIAVEVGKINIDGDLIREQVEKKVMSAVKKTRFEAVTD